MRQPRRLPGPVPQRWVKLTVTGSNAEWWRALHESRARGEAPHTIEPLANGTVGELVLLDDAWRHFYQFARSLPGWAERDGIEQLTADLVEDPDSA